MVGWPSCLSVNRNWEGLLDRKQVVVTSERNSDVLAARVKLRASGWVALMSVSQSKLGGIAGPKASGCDVGGMF